MRAQLYRGAHRRPCVSPASPLLQKKRARATAPANERAAGKRIER
jgi:hypothetical protein